MNGQMGMNPPPPAMVTPAFFSSNPIAIPMHQPRPQKTVSVADIESPASFHFKAPPQQQEQPFHQQVPTSMSNSYSDDGASQIAPPNVPGTMGATPLSQIPEGAVFAQGFQPYPAMGGPPYFGTPYNDGPVFYPTMAGNTPFGAPMSGPVLAPSFIPGSQSHQVGFPPPAALADRSGPGSMVAHESNGMVYYYNQPVFPSEAPGGLAQFPVPSNNNMVNLAGGSMPSQPPFYYPGVPNGVFYPAQTD
jgi:hypothetical protein